MAADDRRYVRYEELDDGKIAVVTLLAPPLLAPPEARDAQNKAMTYHLDDAFTRAAFTRAAFADSVKCIVLAAEGPHFAAGHDLNGPGEYEVAPQWVSGSATRPGTQGLMAFEEDTYFHICRRWHDIPKPMIAAVQGHVMAGGLMLMCVSDIIIAADEAGFRDMTVEFGINGVEWFSHPWELGVRKAKELLFTGDPVSAHDANLSGMVNHVIPADELLDRSLDMGRELAQKPSFALKLAKMSVNQALHAHGYQTAQQAAFSL